MLPIVSLIAPSLLQQLNAQKSSAALQYLLLQPLLPKALVLHCSICLCSANYSLLAPMAAPEELTSESGSEIPAIMECTSESEKEDSPPMRRTRGRGRGRAPKATSKPKAQSSRGSSRPAAEPKAKHRPRGRGRGKSQTSWLHKPKAKQEYDGEETSMSEETARIKTASKKARTWRAHPDLPMEDTSSSDPDDIDHALPAATDDSTGGPKTSAVFDYAVWFLGEMTPDQRAKLARSFSYMDLCAGLGTSLIVQEALRRAMLNHGLQSKGRCTCLTESNAEKREALQRRLYCIESQARILKSNAALSAEDMPENIPTADILFMGIVCVDISIMSSTPKSLTDPAGASGTSWLDLLAYLDKLTLEDRPKVIVLECVENLGNNRALAGQVEKGTIIVVDALREHGYVGQWVKISATHFHLPQRRPRMWGFFLKVRGGMGPKAIAARQRDVESALDLIRRGEASSHEPLHKILARIPNSRQPGRSAASSSKQAWRTDLHPAFRRAHDLTDEDVQPGQDDFFQKTSHLMQPREVAAVWLNLCKLRKRNSIPDWTQEMLVSDCGSSVNWMSITKDMFPCLRPGNKYLLLQHGEPKLAGGAICMAVQGIGPEEASAFNLNVEDDSALRNWAGNAFCANICCIFLIAAISAL